MSQEDSISPLMAIEQSELLVDADISAFLQNTKSDAIVLKSGKFFHAIEISRVVVALTQQIRALGLDPAPTKVSPMEINYWRQASAPRSGSTSLDQGKTSNQSVEHIFARAIDAKSSDVYVSIDTRDTNEARVSFRTFGFKRLYKRMSASDGASFATASWALSDTKSWKKNEPCDVAFTFTHEGKDYRIRGNSVNEVRGNSLVFRIRDPKFVLSLIDSGYSDRQRKHINHMMAAPGGMLLITGETNSGKSTTLTSLMAGLSEEQHIIEIADPPEAEFPHVIHIEINNQAEDAQQKIRKILAATVRQNPDSLILGEIRDETTAMAAMNMAIQGKRVMSTLHTKQCTSAIPRLINLGVDEGLTALPEFITGIVSQNLVPKLCTHCRLSSHPDQKVDTQYKTLFGSGVRFRNEDGCDQCNAKVPGIAGETLVAEVYPLCLDKSAGAFELIAESKLYKLPKYMRENFKVQTKFEHAADKIKLGQIDPIATAEVIGEFLPDLVETGRKDLVAS